MHTDLPRWRLAHDYCLRHSCYGLLLGTGLSLFLLSARIVRSEQITHAELTWNLFLAWVPYLASLWASSLQRRHPRRPWLLLLPGLLWLAFFPNAPYMLTDLWALRWWTSFPFWYDFGLVSLFALTGLLLGVVSLGTMQRLVAAYAGRWLGWLFSIVVVGLSGLGIYLGRFLRWNSWDLLLNPRAVLADVAVRLASPLDHAQTFGFTLLYAAIVFVVYLTLTSRDQ
jgi:uncharacterized membrane protein